jgi:tetratricopeptide (TPR) repeat protein
MGKARGRATVERNGPGGKAGAIGPRGPRAGAIALTLGAILVLTAVVFSSAFSNHFLNWDDPANVTENPYIRAITWDTVKAWFTTPLLGMYSPLVYLSYAIDFRLGHLDPFAYHLTNLLLHLLNAALVLLIVFRLTASARTAAIVSALFAVHPVNVAAVTPVSVRSSLLCSFFYLGAYLAYLHREGWRPASRDPEGSRYGALRQAQGVVSPSNHGAEAPPSAIAKKSARWLWLSWLLFSMSVLAKSAAVVFPLLLFLTDWYLRRPFTRRRVLEKVPFLAVALAFAIVGFAFREDTAAMAGASEFRLGERVCLAGYSLLRYGTELVAPIRLSAYYPYPERVGGHLPVEVYLAPVAVAAAAWLVARARAKKPLIVFGALFFLTHVLLVLKLVPVGAEWMADRYLYLPSIGLFLVAIEICRPAARRFEKPAVVAVAVLVALLSVAAHARSGAWKDDLTFYGDIIAKYPNAPIAYSNRAAARLREAGDPGGALADCERAIRLDPDYVDAHFNCATAKMMLHRPADALRDVNAAIALNAQRAEYYQVRADARLAVGDYRGAMADSDRTIALAPRRAEVYMAYVSRGIAKVSLSDTPGALRDFDAAIALDPNVAVVYQNRANARALAGDLTGARADYDAALTLDPSLATAYYYRGLLKQKLGDASGSCEDFRAASGRGVAAAQLLVSRSCAPGRR